MLILTRHIKGKGGGLLAYFPTYLIPGGKKGGGISEIFSNTYTLLFPSPFSEAKNSFSLKVKLCS